MSKEGVRLSGHELRDEGTAYEMCEGRPQRTMRGSYVYGTSGGGFGLCTCGAKSEVLTSGTKRKQWHREHKQAIRDAANA